MPLSSESNQPSFSKVSISLVCAYSFVLALFWSYYLQRKTPKKSEVLIFLKLLKEKLLFLKSMFLHWKGEVRLSLASHVIRPGKSFPNFNSKFSANLDFKEFELRPLNLQQVYVPCQIKGALAFQTHSSKRFVFLRIIQMVDASLHDLHFLSIFSTCYNLKTTKQTIFSIHPKICHFFLSTTNFRQSPLVFF